MHRFPYRWTLKDARFTKDKGKVFSTFSCGGGSTMGYKLAGFDVIGNLEFDEKKNATYVANHHPRHNYCEDIRTFRKRDDLPQELYELDVLDGSPPCFLEGELVMTSNGYKEIQDVQVGDLVLTHTNSFQRVIDVMNRQTDGFYDLKVQGCSSTLVTPSHPFYVRTMIRKGERRIFSAPTWKTVKELDLKKSNSNTTTSQDYIGVAINQNAIIPKYESIEFNKDLLYIIGRWFGDGWLRVFENNEPYRENIRYTKRQGECKVCGKPCKPHKRYKGWFSQYCSDECKLKFNRQRKKNRYTFILCCSKDEKEEMMAALDRLPYRYTLTEQRTTYRFSIENKSLVGYMMRFGKGAMNKHLTSDILDLPRDLLEAFLNGYLDADGNYDKTYKTYRCVSVSKHLIYGIQACVHKVYHTPTRMVYNDKKKTQTIEGRNVNVHPAWLLTFNKETVKQQHAIYEDGYLWIPYRGKKYIDKEVAVYNISVDRDESYTVNNLICHNCLSFSMSGDREAVWGKDTVREGVKHSQTWDDLFFELIALAERLQPKVVVAENVKGLLLGNAISYVRRIYDEFDKAGYYCQHFLLNAATMGVPQKRERVFFICLRKDLAEPFLCQKDMFTQVPRIDMTFNEDPIRYGEFADHEGDDITQPKLLRFFEERRHGDVAVSDAVERAGEKRAFFNQQYLYEENVSYTLTAHRDSIVPFDVPRWLSKSETCNIASFPQDYDFCGNTFWELCGRAVPPVMMANISTKIYEQWISRI